MTSRRSFVAAAVLATAAAGTLAATGSASADPGHEGLAPGDVTTYDGPLTLIGPDGVVARRYGGRAYVNLRVRALAGAGDLEVRSNRPAVQPYHGPITTTWTLGEQSGTFPEGMQQDFSGLPGLLRVVYRDADGTRVARQSLDACLNGSSVRLQPEGDASNAYPWGCPYNAFTLGSVQGVQQGWATRIDSWGSSVRLPVGEYQATVALGAPYVEQWGLDREEAHVEVPVTIREPRRSQEEWWRPRATAARTASDDAPAQPDAQPAANEPAARASSDLPEGTPVPDLRSLPAFDIGLNAKGNLLRFAANVWNAGNSPLVVDGFRTADEEVMAAYQYFFDADGEQVAYQAVEDSGFYWHGENHDHWHFQDFARYRLLAADRETVLRDSGKVSFCLANTDAVDYTVDGADWRPENTDLSTACGGRGSLSVREVLSAGSGDTYAQYRAGQAFGRIDQLPNGRYYVLVEANPFEALVESDETNNDALRRVVLKGTPEDRRLVVAQVGVIDEQAGSHWFFRTMGR